MSPIDACNVMAEADADLNAREARFAALIHELIHEANGCPLLDCRTSVLVEAAPDGSWRRFGRVES